MPFTTLTLTLSLNPNKTNPRTQFTMSQPVVLILGNDSFSTRVAEIARDSGNTVALASPVAKDLDKYVSH